MRDINDIYGLISAQSALLGIVTSNLRAVTIKVDNDNKFVKVCFFYEGDISDEEFDNFSCAITEIISDFPPNYQLEEHVERLDMPQKIPIDGRLVYLRKE